MATRLSITFSIKEVAARLKDLRLTQSFVGLPTRMLPSFCTFDAERVPSEAVVHI